MIYISYATKNTPYEKVIKDYLGPSLQRFGFSYFFDFPKDMGSWQANTHYKAQFIKDCLLQFHEPVVFLDSDATVRKEPKLFEELERKGVDFGLHFLDWCYSDDTEIYTNNGWKTIYTLSQNDKVATLNPKNKELEYQYFTNFRYYPYNGKMCHFKSQSIDLLVPPKHRMVYIYDSGKKYYNKNKKQLRVAEAEKLYNNQRFYIPKTCKWKGNNPNFFELPKYYNSYGNNKNLEHERNKIKIPIKLWVKFLGWYLSEGCLQTGTVIVSQKIHFKEVKKTIEKISKILNCNYAVYNYKNKCPSFHIFSTQLNNYLKQFGLAKQKHIPSFIKNLNSNLLKLFLSTYIKGDGHSSKKKAKSVFTSSKQMAKDLEEIIFKSGYTSNISLKKSGFGHNVYIILIRNRKNISIRKKYKSIKNYKGYIFGITVPNGIIYVRRKNGKQCWSGNCKLWRNKEGNRIKALSGTLFVNYTSNALNFLDEWIEENNRSKDWEQRNMQKVLDNFEGLSVYNLPFSYCTVINHQNEVPEHMLKEEDVVILHHQKSRQYKRRGNEHWKEWSRNT